MQVRAYMQVISKSTASDFVKAAKLDPKNADVRSTYETCKKQEKAYKDKSKGIFV